jgi:hypothetical protein
MYENKKVIAVTPAGRKRYVEILKNYILTNEIIDEWQIWQNTTNQEDIEYFAKLEKANDKIVVEKRPGRVGHCGDIHKFFDKCIEKNTVYVRFDDDVVWMEKDAVKNIVSFRTVHPEYFLVYGNIINNAICDHIRQRLGAFETNMPMGHAVTDTNAWRNPFIAELKHRNLIEKIKNKDTKNFVFNEWVLTLFERVSINVISWLGEEFAKFDGKVNENEEQWLSVVKPREINKPNSICGNALFGHFSFFVQRAHMDGTNILGIYKEMADNLAEISVNKQTETFQIL